MQFAADRQRDDLVPRFAEWRLKYGSKKNSGD